MTKNKINKNTNNTSKKIIIGYGLIVSWVSLLALTDYSSWIGSNYTLFGTYYPPVPIVVLFLILFVPVLLLAAPLVYQQNKSSIDSKKNITFYASVALQVAGILIATYVLYILLNMLVYGLF